MSCTGLAPPLSGPSIICLMQQHVKRGPQTMARAKATGLQPKSSYTRHGGQKHAQHCVRRSALQVIGGPITMFPQGSSRGSDPHIADYGVVAFSSAAVRQRQLRLEGRACWLRSTRPLWSTVCGLLWSSDDVPPAGTSVLLLFK